MCIDKIDNYLSYTNQRRLYRVSFDLYIGHINNIASEYQKKAKVKITSYDNLGSEETFFYYIN